MRQRCATADVTPATTFAAIAFVAFRTEAVAMGSAAMASLALGARCRLGKPSKGARNVEAAEAASMATSSSSSWIPSMKSVKFHEVWRSNWLVGSAAREAAMAAALAACKAVDSACSRSTAKPCTRKRKAARSERAAARSRFGKLLPSPSAYRPTQSSSRPATLLLCNAVLVAFRNCCRNSSPNTTLRSPGCSSNAARRKLVREKSRSNEAAFSDTRCKHEEAALRTTAVPTPSLRVCAEMASSQRSRHVSMASAAARKAASRCCRRALATARPRRVKRRQTAAGVHSTKSTAERASASLPANTARRPRATERQASPAPLLSKAVVDSVMMSAH
mmetsp:Transcript_81084/g.234485  ORF Transcript_81084/g.234485 Transcript_81084/m.234485 type:complete len:334 (+) Transcript_81084:1697-2698(+)